MESGFRQIIKALYIAPIWAYTSLDQREKVRATARQTGVWQPGGGSGRLLTRENKIMMPSAFSPMQ